MRRYGGGSRRLGPWLTAVSAAGCCCGLWLLLSLFSLSFSKRGGEEGGTGSTEPADGARDPREYRGTSRTVTLNDKGERKKPRIAIISNAVAFPYGSATTAHWSLFKEYFANKDCYANTHGYDLIIDSRCGIGGGLVYLWWCTSAASSAAAELCTGIINEMRRDSKAIQHAGHI